ncbi:heat shock protein, putative [Ixodes scapularis]|uniref:Heat shock protein, putative n=1 Tax=Ixodes scapularis TaxID=6945 RepID=B7PYP5_IXOSC|nr:heat shock protein, putative [Ixodes scapularis]|eukprot:XP_002403553.1 heat shock protein, putative [Ixodes scapularis]
MASKLVSSRLLSLCSRYGGCSRPLWTVPQRSPTLVVGDSRRTLTQWKPTSVLFRPAGLWRPYSTPQSEPDSKDELHNIIKNTEKGSGPSEKREFQAETRMLLDIVAKSLYSEKEVFVRELVSNASDALEKLRYLRLSAQLEHEAPDAAAAPLEIHIATDKLANTFTIQDTGIGMTHDEVVESLGTIARSGSKEFLRKLTEAGDTPASSIIGQFGVGFYSCFMVADRVEVFTRSRLPDARAVRWSSDGSGVYEVSEAEGVEHGTKIVLHLKPDCADFADEEAVSKVVQKYSNFVGSPVFLNGRRANTLQVRLGCCVTNTLLLFRLLASERSTQSGFLPHKCFAGCALFRDEKMCGWKDGFDFPQISSAIQSSLTHKFCELFRTSLDFLHQFLASFLGIVIPSVFCAFNNRELLQDSALIRKIRSVITSRLVKHLSKSAEKEPESYARFYRDYGVFLKEGILASHEQAEKEEIAQLLRFESSARPAGETVTLAQYCAGMREGQRDIYYLAAPSRQLAESSPYFEAVRSRDVEVLFCTEPYDELVLVQLRQFNRRNITSVEKEMRRDAEAASEESEDVKALSEWLRSELAPMVHKVKVTQRLQSHPCLVSVEEMAAARHFVKTSLQSFSEEERYRLLEPTLEINPDHPIMAKLKTLRSSDPALAKKLARQVFGNAMVAAGLVDDPRKVTSELNDLLASLLEKH